MQPGFEICFPMQGNESKNRKWLNGWSAEYPDALLPPAIKVSLYLRWGRQGQGGKHVSVVYMV